MKKSLSLVLLAFLPTFLLGSETSLKNYGKRQVKEDQEWGEEHLNQLLKSGWNSVTEDSEEFQGNYVKSDEIKTFIGLSAKKENFEGMEEIFQPSQSILANPEKNVGIVSVQTHTIAEEEQFVPCQEAGTYQIAFTQKRVVQPIAAIKNKLKRCRGHGEKSALFLFRSSAEKELEQVKKNLSKDNTLESSSASILEGAGPRKYAIFFHWKHKDNTPSCQNYSNEEILVCPSSEKELWETDFPQDLMAVEANPNCRLLYSQILEGPGVRMIDGQSIFRDTWERQLFFSCEPNAESPCAKLRALGGVLTQKRCVKDNRFGECDLWEKTYDIGKKAARKEKIPVFDAQEIWGLSEVFDSSYDKNTEIGDAVSTLSIFSNIKKELEISGRDFGKDAQIFRGEIMQCQCSFIEGALYDCCKKMNGLAVAAYLARCNAEEQSLAERRDAGQCHHVGSYKENLNIQTAQVFCCFSTKLARIVQEQGREQLRIKWGKADSPECRGLSLSELQRIDFNRIDLSDAIEDVPIDKQDLLSKIRMTIDHLEGKANTENIVQKQEERKNGL